MATVDEQVHRVGRGQRGLVTRAQLRRLGIAGSTVRRRLASGSWSEPLPGVVDLGGHARTWDRDVQAVLLAAGERAVASHRTAGHLHGFLDVRRPREVDVLVPRGRHARVGQVRLHTTRDLAVRDVVRVEGIACTGPGRTLWDLAPRWSVDQLERLALDLGRRRPGQLRRAGELVAANPGAPGSGRLREALDRIPAAIRHLESPLEVDAIRRLRAVGLLPPVLQHVIRDADGRYVRRVDAAWPARRVCLEFDGAVHHGTQAARQADARVRGVLEGLGWTVIVFRAADLRGAAFEASVAELRDLVTPGERG